LHFYCYRHCLDLHSFPTRRSSDLPDKRLAGAGKDAFSAMRLLDSLNRTTYNPSGGAQYGQGGELGRNLQQIARLIKADAGVEAEIGRAHVCTPVTDQSRMPSSACK